MQRSPIGDSDANEHWAAGTNRSGGVVAELSGPEAAHASVLMSPQEAVDFATALLEAARKARAEDPWLERLRLHRSEVRYGLRSGSPLG